MDNNITDTFKGSFKRALGSGLAGAAVSAGTSLLGSLFDQSQSKRMMRYQQQLQREQFDYEHQTQLNDILNSYQRDVTARKNAGLSAVDDNGGSQAQVPQAAIGDVSQGQSGHMSVSDLFSNASMASQIELNKANAAAAYALAQKNKTDSQIAQEKWNAEQPYFEENVQASLKKLWSEVGLNEQNQTKAVQEGAKLAQEVAKITFDMEQTKKLNEATVTKLNAETKDILQHAILLEKEGKLTDAKTAWQNLANTFGQYGIGIASDPIQAIAALALSGKSGEATGKLVDAISDILDKIVEKAQSLSTKIVTSAGETLQGIGKGVVNGVTGLFGLPPL